jgi:diacylglycerol kinase (ATP)
MKRQKFLFVINPIAGGLDKSRYVKDLDDIFLKKQKNFHVIETRGKGEDEQRIDEVIQAYHPDVVVAVGGDGTCNLVASIIQDQDLLFGIVPLGSANGLAAELNIEDDVMEATDLLFSGSEKNVDAILINDQYICLHLSDIGLNAKVVKRFEENKVRGMFGYFRQFIREIRNAQPKKFGFEMDRNYFEKSALMVVIANASKYGTGAIVNPESKLDDGMFEICIVKPFPFYAFFAITFHLFKGTLRTSGYVDIISTQHIIIHNLPQEVLQIDGEIHDYPQLVEAKIRKHAFKFIVPC